MEANESKFNIAETIRNIRKAREELRQAVRKENICCSPMLTDYKLVPRLYGMFCELAESRKMSEVDIRKLFIFIIQYLYAPRNLVGCKMPSGLRRVLAGAMGVNAMSVVSRGASETLHHYQVYTQFRDEVNRIFGEMSERMRSEGIIL